MSSPYLRSSFSLSAGAGAESFAEYSDDVKLEALKVLGALTPLELAPYVMDVFICLKSSFDVVKLEARKVLGTLTQAELEPHVTIILQRLESCSEDEKLQAQTMLCALTQTELASCVGCVSRCLGVSSDVVKLETLKVLGKLEAMVLAPYAWNLLSCLEGSSDDVKLEARKLLCNFTPTELAPHAGDVFRCLKVSSDDVKFEALKVLGTLTPRELAPSVGFFFRFLGNSSEAEKLEALKVLGTLTPSVLAPYDRQILECHQISSNDVQLETLKALGTLTRAQRAPYDIYVLRCLESSSENVRLEALEMLSALTPAELAPHVGCIMSCLDTSSDLVKFGVFRALGTLTPGVHLQEHSAWKDANNNSALHIAASIGDVTSCELLTRAGFPHKVKNSSGKLPIDLAKMKMHSDVVDLFSRCAQISATCVGSGDAWEHALVETQCITKVEWYTMPLPGLGGSCGGLHSLICLSVGSSGNTRYVLEKALRSDDQTEQFKNGVHISYWVDVGPKLATDPCKTLRGDDIAHDISIRSVWQVAVNIGPYNLGCSNCHHAAQEMFNACAKEQAKTTFMPNRLPSMAFRAFGILAAPLQRFGRSTSCTSISSESVPLVTHSTSNMYAEGMFPLRDALVELVSHRYEHTALAAELSAWIYKASELCQRHIHFHNSFGDTLAIFIEETREEIRLCSGATKRMKVSDGCESVHVRVNYIGLFELTSLRTRLLRFQARPWRKYRFISGTDNKALYEECDLEATPKGTRVKYLRLLDDGNVVQWAIVTAAHTAYIVFKGTSEFHDHFINTSFLTCDDGNKLRVHSGMWNALRQTRSHTIDEVMKELRVIDTSRIVICGHSLGGGYAILVGLELLANGFHIDEVLTFGAPQVVVRDYGNELWNKLNDITTLYVNSYDMIPRLPSFLVEWSQEVPLKEVPLVDGCSFRFGFDLSRFYEKNFIPKQLLSDYDTVGTLMFICTGSSMAMEVSSADANHKEILGRLPEQVGPFMLTQHHMSEYLSIVSHVRKSAGS